MKQAESPADDHQAQENAVNIRPLGGLEANPFVAMWLGAFVGEFATIEFLIVRLMATVLSDDMRMRTAWIIMGRIRSIPDRCNMLKDAARESKLSQMVKDKIVTFSDQIIELNALRNKYVHGMYHHDSTTRQVWVQTWTMTISRKSEKFEVTEEIIKARRHANPQIKQRYFDLASTS